MKTISSTTKWIIASLCLVAFCSRPVIAQKSGVFRTYADFQAGKMDYGINCQTEKHKIKLNEFLGKDFITIIHDGKPYNLKKTEIWGYQLCDEKVVRFQGNDHFSLDDKGILWVYSKQFEKMVSPKSGTKSVTSYFFSTGGDGEIKELTLMNLKAAFPDNHKLHDAIDAQFKTDASLIEFDQYHKHYKINHFLEGQELK